ncbi:hypothetical protein ACVWWI_004208 [Bradyrhizobium sp. USDA 3686]|uniref:hypothetical protein n=1 Tax=Bradyrhizobium TaxID=374 RepID=UPI001E57E95B|nr:hypothetical protein [Bradyrhizobium canariense]MBM7482480.1 hypothetical protein [Bradyrhizobium canariense]UFW69390.1 hypothetical protein BcanWU425_21800 [Bradyrhizobium canariense]
MADELPAELTRLTALANILGELLFALIRSIVAGWAYALWVKLATWLEPKIQRRWVKIAVGGLLGLAAFFMIPIVMALLGL